MAALVFALHAAFVAPFVLVASVHKRPVMPDMPGGSASALTASARQVEAMTLVDLSRTAQSETLPLEELASIGIEIPKLDIFVATPELAPIPMFEEEAAEDSEATEAAGDIEGHARMFGRYLGQISARIERAWRRPRSAIGAPRFSCQTKIEQDEHGKVLSVELRHCNGDARWQQSLVTAIEHASPLPAPPTWSVFARMLVLDFSAQPFQAGLSDERAYEPEVRLAASEPPAPAYSTPEPDTLRDLSQYEGPIYLRIEGNKVTWTLEDSAPTSD